jgi:hypothetical protein
MEDRSVQPGRIRIGSEEHKKLFCREFIASFRDFKVSDITWPHLDRDALERLRALPFWGEALKTELTAGARVRRMADCERDPLIREAIALQSHEETRHGQLLEALMRHCGLDVPEAAPDKPGDPEWGFMRMGYGEIFDTFFAFGLFKLAGDTGFFPPSLMEIFEGLMQEEARHIIFFANWAAYRNRTVSLGRRSWVAFRRCLALSIQALGRIHTALDMVRGRGAGDDFVMQVPEGIARDVSLRAFLETCLREDEARLSASDPRLIKPRVVARVARLFLGRSGRASSTQPPQG